MAYLRELHRVCQSCDRQAVVELVNARNAPIGHYCRLHGERELRRTLDRESQPADDRRG